MYFTTASTFERDTLKAPNPFCHANGFPNLSFIQRDELALTKRIASDTLRFGGSKMSGWGNEHGIQSLEEYLNVKTVWMNTTPGRRP